MNFVRFEQDQITLNDILIQIENSMIEDVLMRISFFTLEFIPTLLCWTTTGEPYLDGNTPLPYMILLAQNILGLPVLLEGMAGFFGEDERTFTLRYLQKCVDRLWRKMDLSIRSIPSFSTVGKTQLLVDVKYFYSI